VCNSIKEEGMHRLCTVLKEYEKKKMCKIESVEGEARVVFTSIPYWLCGVDEVDLYSERKIQELRKQMRHDNFTDCRRSNRIVSPIKRIVGAAIFVLIASHGKSAIFKQDEYSDLSS
jgi:hypothetical protein